MTHECTNCGRRFPDGSKEMLSGCPDCGGNKFRYRPEGGRLGSSDRGSGSTTGSTPESATGSASGDSTGSAAPSPSASSNEDREERPSEDAAQAGARKSVVDPDEILGASGVSAVGGPDPAETAGPGPDAPETPAGGPESGPEGYGADPEDLEDPTDAEDTGDGDEESNLTELRDELNDQFESIKIVEPGQYELNLMELYDRDAYIISLREDGRYVIEMSDSWRGKQL
jgi:predicted  nucleic acid-binding Zn-ribbon protein